MLDNIENPAPEASEAGTEGIQQQQLDEVTFEPQASIEQVGNYQQAEAIQASLVSVIDTASSLTGGGEAVSTLPIPLPTPPDKISGNIASVDPIPLPYLAEQVVSTGSRGDIKEIGGLTPIQLPMPTPDDLGGDTLSTTSLKGDESLISHGSQVPEGPIDPTLSGVGRAGMSVLITSENDNTAEAVARESPVDSNATYNALHSLAQQANADLNADKDVRLQELSGKEKSSEQQINQKASEIEANISSAQAAGLSGAFSPATVVVGTAARAQSGGMEQAIKSPANVDLSAFTGSVEVLAAGPVREIRAGSPRQFEGRDPADSVIQDAPLSRSGMMADPDRGLRIEGAASGETVEDQKPAGVYAYTDSSGRVMVVDADGNLLFGPQGIKVIMGADGQEHVFAHFPDAPDGVWVELENYDRSLAGCHVTISSSGSVFFFDADGKQILDRPSYTEQTDSQGKLHIIAWYPGHEDEKTEIPILTHSLDGCSVSIGPGGEMNVVGSDGFNIPLKPSTSVEVGADGKEHVYAWYPDSSDGGKVELPFYSTPLAGCTAKMLENGDIVIINATGQKLTVQPSISTTVGADGQEHVFAWYPSTGEAGKVEIPFYTASLEGCQALQDGPNYIVIVDAKGKALPVQPLTAVFTGPDGQEHVYAWWPNDVNNKVVLPWGKPAPIF